MAPGCSAVLASEAAEPTAAAAQAKAQVPSLRNTRTENLARADAEIVDRPLVVVRLVLDHPRLLHSKHLDAIGRNLAAARTSSCNTATNKSTRDGEPPRVST